MSHFFSFFTDLFSFSHSSFNLSFNALLLILFQITAVVFAFMLLGDTGGDTYSAGEFVPREPNRGDTGADSYGELRPLFGA